MGKASRRRMKKRKAYLAQLAEQDPQRFIAEWNKRLRSWSREVNVRVNQDAPLPWLGDEDARDPRTFALVQEALELLASCGKDAFDSEAEATREILTACCSMAIAREFDLRMCRLSNSASNRERMEHYAFAIPR